MVNEFDSGIRRKSLTNEVAVSGSVRTEIQLDCIPGSTLCLRNSNCSDYNHRQEHSHHQYWK